MKEIERLISMSWVEDNKSGARRAGSLLIVCLLVASGLLMIFPMRLPSVEAIKYHWGGTASWEDDDMSDGVADGLDYNGDPANDNMITWHSGADNPHIINANFTVESEYTLEIEAGAQIKLDPGVFINVLGDINSYGTLNSPVNFTQNVTGSLWGKISIISGYADIIYTGLNGGEGLFAFDSWFLMEHSTVANMKSYGIYSQGSWTEIINSQVLNSGSAAIFLNSSDGVISNCNIQGYNGDLNEDGGHCIYITGFTPYEMVISNNTMFGGRGGENDNDYGEGGTGGYGIFGLDYDGRVKIADNIIQGGEGGDNYGVGGDTGEGGIGVHFFPVANYDSPPAIEIVYNEAIIGGRGGDNLNDGCFPVGNGACAIWISDNDIKGGDFLIRGNKNIIGGRGGDNRVQWIFLGWEMGKAGDGIVIKDCRLPGEGNIYQNANICGGEGGNPQGDGDDVIGTIPAGRGGNGITISGSNGITIDDSTIIGGKGGENWGDVTQAGKGGNGIRVGAASGMPSDVTIKFSTIRGGNGGDNWKNYMSHGGPGNGGVGLRVAGSSGSCYSSYIFGGNGSDNYKIYAFGGDGASGGYISNSPNWTIQGGKIIGGKGGDDRSGDGKGGGEGEAAINIKNSINISLESVQDIVGGNGGDAGMSEFGPGPAAERTINLFDRASDIKILGCNITTGTGGYNASGNSYGQNGSYCIYGADLDGSNTIAYNNITAKDTYESTYGIWLESSVADISDNHIFNNWRGILILDSEDITIGDNNRISDNYLGIYLMNSNGTIGSDNIICNNSFGIYCNGSNPKISGDQVINSSVYAILCDSGSWPKLINCTISSNPGASDFHVEGDSHPWTLNTTFNKTDTIFLDTSSNLTVNWFMHVRIVNNSYLPEENADLWVNDTYGDNLYSGQTPGDGWIRDIIVTEYIENQMDGKSYYTPHDISAAKGSRFGFEKENMGTSKEIMEVLGTSFPIPLKEGWNLISIPLIQEEQNLTRVLDAIDGLYDTVQWYDAGDISDSWKHNKVGKPLGNDLSELNETMSFWINITQPGDTIFNNNGTKSTSNQTIPLYPGWNMVGYPSFTSYNRSSGLNNLTFGDDVDAIQWYDAATRKWHFMEPDDLFVPGRGYWVHSKVEAEWEVPQ